MKPLKNIFKKKNPKDEAVDRAMHEWDEAQKQVEGMSEEALGQLIENANNPSMVMIHAAYELAKRGRAGDLASMFVQGNSTQAIAAVEGLCYAACNGNSAAVEGVAAAGRHPDPAVRLRLVRGLSMVADGTPGESGATTPAIRKRAREIIGSARNDPNSEVARWADNAFGDSEHVEAVRRGEGTLTYLGRQYADHVIKAVEAA